MSGRPAITASGLRAAWARWVTATWPSWALVVPKTSMCRRIGRAKITDGPSTPNGALNAWRESVSIAVSVRAGTATGPPASVVVPPMRANCPWQSER